MSRSVRALLAAAAAAVALLGACTSSTSGSGALADGSGAPTGTASPSTSSSPSGSAGPTGSPSCPAAAIAPDPHRPVVALDFVVADDLQSVAGTEKIVFTPDLPVDRLVFRLTANTAPTVQEGNGITVTSASANHGAGAATYEAAGAAPSTQGGLLVLPFASTVPAGTSITAQISFSVTLGEGSFDRFGRQAGFAWFASAQPLLAWERGFGWHTEPMLQFTAESATSEAAHTDLTVTAPAGLTVLMSGNPTSSTPVAPSSGGAARASWHATQASARDVSVAVGPFVLSDTTVAAAGSSIPLRIGAPSQAIVDSLVPEFQRAVTQLSELLGPFPFPALSVARVPAGGGGIEYPGAILMLDGSRMVAVHETAHQWFYAMVGDSQALHAWLDEAFASWAEQVVDNDPPPAKDLAAAGAVDTPTADYGSDDNGYYFVTYDKGAAALHAASAAVGDEAFQAAIRCYVKANAWRIANPPDLAASLADLPKAVAVLKQAGALS